MKPVTRIRTVGADPTQDPAVREAGLKIKAGEVVALPTETVYGLAADATNADAVARIFEVKNRPQDNPLIVHLADADEIETYCETPGEAFDLLSKAFWPGPLTLVLKAKPLLKETVCRGLDTVAVRIPNHPVARAVIREAGVPLAAPSANLSGRPSPTRAKHVYNDLRGRLELILDGGECEVGIESTVLDLSEGKPVILRPGRITRTAMEAVLQTPVTYLNKTEQERRSPGTRYRHYAPKSPLYLVHSSLEPETFTELVRFLKGRVVGPIGYIGSRIQPGEDKRIKVIAYKATEIDRFAHDLYANLRDLERYRVEAILVDGFRESSQTESILDRLKRAANRQLSDEADLQRFMEQFED